MRRRIVLLSVSAAVLGLAAIWHASRDRGGLPDEEQLVLRVALATCFSHRVDPENTSIEDVEAYVGQLIRIFQLHPNAPTHSSPPLPQDMRGALEFCAGQIEVAAPNQAQRLRVALSEEVGQR